MDVRLFMLLGKWPPFPLVMNVGLVGEYIERKCEHKCWIMQAHGTFALTMRALPSFNAVHHRLTLLGMGGGHICPPPCHVFAYIRANTRTSALKTTWLFQIAENYEVRQKYQNFLRGTLTNWVGGLSDQWKIRKVNHFCGGFWSSKLHESFWIW